MTDKEQQFALRKEQTRQAEAAWKEQVYSFKAVCEQTETPEPLSVSFLDELIEAFTASHGRPPFSMLVHPTIYPQLRLMPPKFIREPTLRQILVEGHFGEVGRHNVPLTVTVHVDRNAIYLSEHPVPERLT